MRRTATGRASLRVVMAVLTPWNVATSLHASTKSILTPFVGTRIEQVAEVVR